MSEARQQYEAMQECIQGFKAHTMKLGDLVEILPEQMKAVDHPDEAWKAEWMGYWWTLEQVHGDAIDLGESGRLPEGTRETVDDAIEGLERLVNSALSAH